MMEVVGDSCIIDGDYLINVADYMLPRPSRKYCKRILHEDDKELPIISVEIGVWE